MSLYEPAIPLFCRTLTTTRRFWACPSAVLSLPTCRLSPMAPGASISGQRNVAPLQQKLRHPGSPIFTQLLVQCLAAYR